MYLLQFCVQHSYSIGKPYVEVVDITERAESKDGERQHEGFYELRQRRTVDIVCKNALHVPVGV